MVLLEDLQDLGNYLAMFFQGLGENQYIIHVDGNYSFFDEFPEDIIHHGLEGGWAVAETKEHHQWFIEPPISSKGSLPLVSFSNANVVVTPANIKFSEVFSTFHSTHDVWDEGEGVPISYGDLIQLSIVLDKAKGAILFLDEEHR